MKRLCGKTAAITSGGIGLGIAKRFAEEGADLILLGEICSVQNIGAAAAFFGIGCGEIGRRAVFAIDGGLTTNKF